MVPIPASSSSTRYCAPRASGDGPLRPRLRRTHLRVLPARAGMVPPRPSSATPHHGAPRASGDGPAGLTPARMLPSCSPRERGWSQHPGPHDTLEYVLPARAGMVLSSPCSAAARVSAPRASGDGPDPAGAPLITASCSPRERGWSLNQRTMQPEDRVLPARAGMVPVTETTDSPVPMCSPRERGWSHFTVPARQLVDVLPARAGMVPVARLRRVCRGCAPRASGDGPTGAHTISETPEVLPARAGMVPVGPRPRRVPGGAPRASGDGPDRRLRSST